MPKWLQTLGQDDVVVGYYTSHGVRDEERFYMLTRDSEEGSLDTTSVPAEDLARWVSKNTRTGQILVILDACYSGKGAAEFTAVVGKLTAAAGGNSAVFVVAAARSKQEAAQGGLSSAIEAALANADGRLGGATQRFLALDDVMESVDVFLRTHNPSQTATWSSANVRGRARVFPNPRFRPQVQPGLDLESQRALLEHWVPKAMGAEVGASGWYFTGRRAALEAIVSWLSGDLSDSRARVVTGGAGCGKSALLARIVTLSEPSTRSAALAHGDAAPASAVPPERIVDVAIHARRKLVAELVRLLAEPLGIAALDSRELIGALMKRPGKTVILIDALDEADERTETVSQLLQPLAALPNVFLLISTRPDSTGPGLRFRAMGESTVEIDLDDPRYFDSQDIERYVERRLLAVEEPNRSTPYRNQPEVARALAEGVAKRARKVFLVARTTVQSLLAADSPVDSSAPGWVDDLPSGVEDAFEQIPRRI